MAVVYLVRHGQASFGAADYDVLSELGHRQSAVLGAELRRRGVQPDVVLSGSMRRQLSTARETLATAAIHVEPQVDERWNEYDHVDVLDRHIGSGRSPQSILDAALRGWVAAGESSPCAESWPKFAARVTVALAELTASLGRGGSAVVFTSGGVIGAAVSQLLGLRSTEPTGFLALNRVTVNAGITKIVHGRSGASLVSFNDHAHFEGDHAALLSYR
ncbi:MAG TPA: histidine phosphatase family protein [Pseudonocardiaceae bacterium]|jgi:broad specificity phosphatase PhoE|nr:histidine phosphatase family protein [Pseudonocardiaceae bacterium]